MLGSRTILGTTSVQFSGYGNIHLCGVLDRLKAEEQKTHPVGRELYAVLVNQYVSTSTMPQGDHRHSEKA